MNLGNNLFEARKKAGLSQESVAEKLGVLQNLRLAAIGEKIKSFTRFFQKNRVKLLSVCHYCHSATVPVVSRLHPIEQEGQLEIQAL